MNWRSSVDMRTGGAFSAIGTGSLWVVVLLLIMPMYAAAAKTAGSGGMDIEIPMRELGREKRETPAKPAVGKTAGSGEADFEIPLRQLSREKQETPVKPAANRVKVKKRSVAKAQKTKAAPGAAAQPVEQAQAPAGSSEAQQSALQTEANQPFRIFNVPYSFVVTGKSTVIKAVIYREADDLQSVNCKIRAAATGANSVVKMAKVDGFRFTYAATLPEAAVDASSLRYTIVAIDSSLTESISPEFASPTKFSPLVPDWQF